MDGGVQAEPSGATALRESSTTLTERSLPLGTCASRANVASSPSTAESTRSPFTRTSSRAPLASGNAVCDPSRCRSSEETGTPKASWLSSNCWVTEP